MGFKDLNLKVKYNSDRDNLVENFYIPVLSRAKVYKRMAGYFSSTSLAIAARGMLNFIENGGKMSLLCNSELSLEDFNALERSIDNPQKFIEESFLSELENLEEGFIKDNVEALGWMVAQGNLEIKVAIPRSNEGIFHPKTAIMEDFVGNYISFSGSENETAGGWVNNIEEFKVFKSWIGGQSEYVYEDMDEFDIYWHDLAKRTDVFSISDVVKDKLSIMGNGGKIKIHNNLNSNNSEEDSFFSKLRNYQNEAIDNWFINGRKGIFEMATGTGKTFTALGCIEKLKKEYLENDEPLLIVIAAPTSHLIDQWEKDVLNFKNDKVIKAYKSYSYWSNQLSEAILDLNIGLMENVVVLVTHKTFSSDKFLELIKRANVDSCLVVDEVHGVGSFEQRKGLADFYDYRLGLSATPKRWNDDDGNMILEEYFGDTVYEFSLSRALVDINPDTGKTFLTPYIYKPIFVSLNSKEREDYINISSDISRYYAIDPIKYAERIKLLFIERQSILNTADSKYDKLKEILNELDVENLKNLIIYCHNSEQLNNVISILDEFNLTKHSFTGSESISQRITILKDFADGDINVLVAMKCLDEGVDVPSAETAIILASTSNPREYIQRRGRILRRHENKELATIYDMIVATNDIGDIDLLSNEEKKLMMEILEKEEIRYKEFALDAKNNMECYNILSDFFRMLL